MKKTNKTPLATTMGAVFISTVGAGIANADVNPFGLTELSSGYMQVATEDAGKAGEMNCGANMGGMTKPKAAEGGCAGKMTEPKASEGGCAGKMTEPKAAKKAADGKCGAGKCGAMMQDGKMKEGMEKSCGAMMKGKEGACGTKKK